MKNYSNELKIVNEQEVLGKKFKVYGTFEEPLFLAKDVAEWIEHSNATMMLSKIDEDEKVLNNVYTLGGMQESWFLTEDGLYEVLMQSRKPIAKAFKKEVKRILKGLRKGELEIKVPQTYGEALKLAWEQQLQIEEKQRIIEEQKPDVEFAQGVSKAINVIPMKELCALAQKSGVKKLYFKDGAIKNIGRNNLMEWLRSEGILCSSKTLKNLPMQVYIDRGYFEVIEELVETATYIGTSSTTYVTGKGQRYLIDKLKKISA